MSTPCLSLPRALSRWTARVVLHDPDMAEEDLPQNHPDSPLPGAICTGPLPRRQALRWRFARFSRKMRPMMAAFNRTLSPYSIYLRYFHPISPAQLVSHDQLASLTFIDYDRENTLVAEHVDERAQKHCGHGAIEQTPGNERAPNSLCWWRISINAPAWAQNCCAGCSGLRDENIERVVAEILPENEGMRRICAKLGFNQQVIPGTRTIYAQVNVAEARLDSAVAEDASDALLPSLRATNKAIRRNSGNNRKGRKQQFRYCFLPFLLLPLLPAHRLCYLTCGPQLTTCSEAKE